MDTVLAAALNEGFSLDRNMIQRRVSGADPRSESEISRNDHIAQRDSGNRDFHVARNRLAAGFRTVSPGFVEYCRSCLQSPIKYDNRLSPRDRLLRLERSVLVTDQQL